MLVIYTNLFKFIAIICLYIACGNVYATNNVRIVGGVVANQGSWPSIAYIRWTYRGDYTLPTGVTVTASAGSACDGTLISTRKILTAGKKRKLSNCNNLN